MVATMQDGDTNARWQVKDVLAFVADKGLAKNGNLAAKPLSGGYWNDVFRVRGKCVDWVVKRFTEVVTGTLFPNLPHAEAAALEVLGGAGVAPTPVAFFPLGESGAVLVYDFHAGAPWSANVRPVAEAMRRQHRVPATGFRAVPVDPAGIIDEGETILERARPDAQLARLRALRPQSKPTPEPLGRRSLIHTDAGAQNIIVGPGGLRIIDWQCPAAGDPAEDAYSFVSDAFQILNQHPVLTDRERNEFLEAYGDEAMAARLEWLEPAFIYRMTAYCILRLQTLAGRDEVARRRYAHAVTAELARLEKLTR
jgi:thiamine kinase